MVDVTPDQVENAMDECDRLGVSNFNEKHNYVNPLKYWVISPSRLNRVYPTKAIATEALGHFSINGGYSKQNSACSVLERAGYTITNAAGLPFSIDSNKLLKRLEAQIKSLDRTERSAIIRQRIGQDLFRIALMLKFERKCVITGISDRELLRASHIKPWRDCADDTERLDLENGLLLSALWDAAFDRGLVSFGKKGEPIASNDLTADAREALTFDQAKPIRMSKAQATYMQWHRGKHNL